MNKVYIYPPQVVGNSYIRRLTEVIRRAGYNVKPFPSQLSSLLKLGRQNILILNWYEERLASPRNILSQLIISALILFYCRVLFRKIVWIKHNVVGHDIRGLWARSIMVRLISFFCDICVTHRPISGAHYIPHPLYLVPEGKEIKTIPFLYYGIIKPYKGLAPLLMEWPASQPLKLIGYCSDKSLECEIRSIVEQRKLNVEWSNKFVDSEYLSAEISKAECVVIPHLDGSMLVSGAALEALAHGANVVMRSGGTAEYFVDNFEGVSVFELDTLGDVLVSVPTVDPQQVKKSIYNVCADEKVSKEWGGLLEKLS